MHDVIVVGAGPAGCSAARAAAEKGASVLLIEKKADIGVPVKCGEYLPTPAEMKRLTPKARKLEELFQVPRRVEVNRTRYIRFIYPNGREAEVKFEANVLERKIYDKLLAQEAARAGAEVRVLARATGLLEGGGVLAKLGSELSKLPAKVVIGADGPLSRIARWAGLKVIKDPMDLGIGLQYEMAKVETDSDVIDMYFGEDYAPGSYAWIIPKADDVANVGISLRVPYMRRGFSTRDYLERFVRRHPIASKKLENSVPTALKAGVVPVGGPIPRTFENHTLVVGDAAGQALPTVGAGIPPALICGDIAGEVAASHIEGEAPLSEYEKRWKKEIGDTLKNSLKLRKIGDLFFKSDKVMNYAVDKWLSEDLLRKFIECRADRSMLFIGKSLLKLMSSIM